MSLTITIEGAQGAGKSNLLRKLELILNHQGYKVFTEEQGLDEGEIAAIAKSKKAVYIKTKQTGA